MKIRFEGTITGEAVKRYLKRSYHFERVLYGCGGMAIFPLVVLLAIKVNDLRIIPAFIFVIIVMLVVTLFPVADKEYMRKVPQRIYISNGNVSVSGKNYKEIRPLSSVKMVKDWGEFYELIFRVGKISPKYQCQKNLLDMGSIKQFEALFEGKIVRM